MTFTPTGRVERAQAQLYRYTRPTRLRSLSVVMPAHNEADNIEAAVLEALHAASLVSDQYEVVVVDDGSTDETADIVDRMILVYGESVRLIQCPHNMGYGPAVRRAWAAAKMDWLLFTDSDCQFDLTEVTRFVPFTDSADIITGRRQDRKDPWPRRFSAHLFNAAGRLIFGNRVRDVDCAFKLMRTAAIRSLHLTANSAMVNTELLYQCRTRGLRVVELPVTHRERQFGVASGGDAAVIRRAMREFVAMRRRFNADPDVQLRLQSFAVAALALMAGVTSTAWAVAHHVVLAYGDAEAHLNIAKRVVSGLTPGFSQLGSVWLPLPHVLMIPFVISDRLWRSGLAGAAISVPSLAVLAVMSYRLAHLLTANRRASWLAPLVILANPNILYLSATPMTEVLLLALVTTSVYFLAQWMLHGAMTSLVGAGLFGALASLARYDGWGLVAVEAVAVGLLAAVRLRTIRGTEGTLILFGVLAFSGVGGWLLWNQLIFKDPLYFSSSVYGSAAQQKFFLNSGLLPAYHNAAKSVIFWLEDIRLIAGSTLGVLALLGLALLLSRSLSKRNLAPALIAFVALSSFGFYILSLYTGQASLILPRFVKAGSEFHLSNVRYGVQALLPIGLFVAYVAGRKRILVPILAAVICLQGLYSVQGGAVMAYVDGTDGLSSQKRSKGLDSPPVEAWMRAHYDGGLVLMDDYRRPIGPVESGVPAGHFIGVGNKPYWQQSLDNPGMYATWIILQKGATDAVWTGFTPGSRAVVDDHFVEVFRSGAIHVFKRRPQQNEYVEKQGQHLYLAGQRWTAVGVDSYDLLAQSQPQIDARLRDAASAGINTIRTWCFDKDGGVSDNSLEKLSVSAETAYNLRIRLVCTLSNNLPDYGGLAHFTSDGEQFFTSEAARAAYQGQLEKVLGYRAKNGRRLGDAAGILAWDLINEPRSDNVPVTAVADWTERMAAYVGSLDQRHLITVGGEGFTTGYPADPHLAATAGTDFSTLCGVPGITLCSAHVYPKYLSKSVTSTQINQAVQTWRGQADSQGKPVYLGEVGYSLEDGDASTRARFYANVAQAVSRSDLDGALLWDLGAKADNSFTLQLGDTASDSVLANWVDSGRKIR
jgi:hypothetical protein